MPNLASPRAGLGTALFAPRAPTAGVRLSTYGCDVVRIALRGRLGGLAQAVRASVRAFAHQLRSGSSAPRAQQGGGPAAPGKAPTSPTTLGDPAVEERVIGRGIAFLLTNRVWVHRRTEYIHFVDADTVKRQMGVDYTLPRRRETEGLYRRRPGLVPLATLEKHKLTDFSLWDEDARRIPMLNTEQNAVYAAAALVASAHGTARLYGHTEAPEPVNVMLRLVAARPTEEAKDALTALRDGLEEVPKRRKDAWTAELELKEHIEALPLHKARAAQLLNGPSEPKPHGHTAARSWEAHRRASATLNSLAAQLAGQFIVLGQLRGEPGDLFGRRLLKFSYEQPPHQYRPELTKRQGARRLLRSGLEVMSWWPKNITLDSVPVGNAASYHVEVVAPDDIELLAARLIASDPERGEAPLRRESTSTEEQRVHLQVSGAPRAAYGPLWVQLRAVRRGFLTAAVLTAGVIAFLLNVGESRLDAITAPEGSSSLEAAATLLVAVPGLVTAYLLRPGEHLMASRLLAGTRLLLLGSAACAFAAAGALAGAYPKGDRDCIWGTAADVSLGLWGALLVSYVLPLLVPAARRAFRKIGHKLKKPR